MKTLNKKTRRIWTREYKGRKKNRTQGIRLMPNFVASSNSPLQLVW